MYRLPALPATVLQDAIEQAERALLLELFHMRTAEFILANAAQPPATTLLSGSGGVGWRWRDVAVPFITARIRWGVAGYTDAEGGRGSEQFAAGWAVEGMVERFRDALEDVARRYWQGMAEVVAVGATTITVQPPAEAVAWARAGMDVKVWAVGQVVSTSVVNVTATTLELDWSTGPAMTVGEKVYYQYSLRTRPRARVLWT